MPLAVVYVNVFDWLVNFFSDSHQTYSNAAFIVFYYQNQNQNQNPFIVIVQSSTTKFVLAALENSAKNNNNRNLKSAKGIKKTVQFVGEEVYLQA